MDERVVFQGSIDSLNYCHGGRGVCQIPYTKAAVPLPPSNLVAMDSDNHMTSIVIELNRIDDRVVFQGSIDSLTYCHGGRGAGGLPDRPKPLCRCRLLI
eukprot:scaffold13233_cov23-Cyclotella_meneghiniana.AAC.1